MAVCFSSASDWRSETNATVEMKGFMSAKMDRRQIIQAFGLGATAAFVVSAPEAAAALSSRAGQEASTGSKDLKAVAWNHLSYNVADVARARDFYVDLFGMKVTRDDGAQSELDFGSPSAVNSIYLRKVKPGQQATVDHLAWSVENFTKDGSGAELKRLGLHPRDDGPAAWGLEDPDGFTAQVAARTGAWPTGPAKGAKIETGLRNLGAIPAPGGKGFQAIGAVVYLYVTDVGKSRDFYANLFGMEQTYYKPAEPVCFLRFGGHDGLCLRKTQRADRKAYVDHFALVVADFKQDAVEAELRRRGLDPQRDTDGAFGIHDPDGNRIAVGGKALLLGRMP